MPVKYNLISGEHEKLKTVVAFTNMQKAEKVGRILQRFAKTHRCMGLAANQLGIMERVCVAKIQGRCIRVFINPVITIRSEETIINYGEGCISWPGTRGAIERHEWIEIEYNLPYDDKRHSQRYVNQDAVVLEHEIDHLDGIRCVDKMEVRNNPYGIPKVKNG